MLTDYNMSHSEEFEFSKMTEKEKQACEAFKEFHQQYIDGGWKQAKLSDIIHSILHKAYPPTLPIMLEQAMSREASIQQLPEKQSATIPALKEAQPTTL